MVEAELSAYLFWEGFEVQETQSAMHLVDTNSDGEPTTVMTSGIFWAFAMWSRHIRPGAYRIAASGSVPDVITGAFVNVDGSVVVIFTNRGSSARSVRLSFGSDFTPSAADAWVTSNSATFAPTDASISGGEVTVDIPSKGVVTVKLNE